MSKTLTPAEAARMKVERIRGDLESVFFTFDVMTANETKAALLRVINKLGNPMQWDPGKGVNAPAPIHSWSIKNGAHCGCFECCFDLSDNDSDETCEVSP